MVDLGCLFKSVKLYLDYFLWFFIMKISVSFNFIVVRICGVMMFIRIEILVIIEIMKLLDCFFNSR